MKIRSLLFRIIVAAFMSFIFSFSPDAAAQEKGDLNKSPPVEDVEAVESSAPVIVDGFLLFRVRGFETYPAKRRAEEIRKRIIKIAQDPKVSVDALRIREGELSTDIMIGDHRLLSVFESDARQQDITRHEFAVGSVTILKEAVERFRAARRPELLWRGFFWALGATALFLAAFFLLRSLFRRGRRIVERRYKRRIQSFKVGSLELIQAERIWSMISGFFGGLRLLVFLALIYFYLQFVLAQFPWTRGLSLGLVGMVTRPLLLMGRAVVDYLPNLIFLLILTLVTVYALKLIRLFFTGLAQGALKISGFEREWAKPTFNLVRVFVIAFVLVVAYPYIPGSRSEAFKGISIFLGVLLSLGSSSAISNVIAGYTMIYRRSFKLGDRIQIGEFTGDVIAMYLLTTHLRTIKNETIVVPNSLILNSNLINFSTQAQDRGLILHATVGIGYETPWRQVEAMLKLAAVRTSGLLQEPPPFVLIKSLDQFSVDYEINVYCRDSHGMWRTYNELHRNILDQFNEHGVQIMTPAYEGDPEMPKVVAKNQWYAAPAAPMEKK